LHKPIFAGKNLLLPAKSVFATAVFTMEKNIFSTVWQKPANPGRWKRAKVKKDLVDMYKDTHASLLYSTNEQSTKWHPTSTISGVAGVT